MEGIIWFVVVPLMSRRTSSQEAWKLIVKPGFLPDDDRAEMLAKANNITLELSWHSGKEIIVLTEKDIVNIVDLVA